MAPTNTIQDVFDAKSEFGFSGVPVTDTGKMGGKLIGLVTMRDIDFLPEKSWKKPVSQVFLVYLIKFIYAFTTHVQVQVQVFLVCRLPYVYHT